MRNRGFPETCSPGIFFTLPHREKDAVGAVRGQLPNTAMRVQGRQKLHREPARGNTMKSGTQDQAEGMFHKVKGMLKEIAGRLGMNSKLEAEGKEEKIVGKVQEKIGQVKKVIGK
jgi:uncharacterized protein YjbJ (UPF0337 family)